MSVAHDSGMHDLTSTDWDPLHEEYPWMVASRLTLTFGSLGLSPPLGFAGSVHRPSMTPMVKRMAMASEYVQVYVLGISHWAMDLKSLLPQKEYTPYQAKGCRAGTNSSGHTIVDLWFSG